jgi:hypothetical protein
LARQVATRHAVPNFFVLVAFDPTRRAASARAQEKSEQRFVNVTPFAQVRFLTALVR